MKKMKTLLFYSLILIIGFSSCQGSTEKRTTTCDCADLTYKLYQDYEQIIFSNDKPLRKLWNMRKVKKECKKTEIYKECRKQGVRPLSIIHYPKNKKIFETCESWKSMEGKIDKIWEKIKTKMHVDHTEMEEDDTDTDDEEVK
jgi:hypothetical protein